MKEAQSKTNNKAIAWLTSAHFVNDIYTGFLNPIMPFIAAKLNFTMFFATIILGIAQVFSALIQPIFGFFADKLNKRGFVFGGLLLTSLFIPLAANAPSILILTLCVILGNLGSSIFHPQSLGFVPKFAGEKIMFYMSIFIAAGTVGFALGPICSSYVAQYLGFARLPYLSIIGVCLALLTFKCVPKISISKQSTIINKSFVNSFKEILSNKFMLILILVSLMKSLITSSCSIMLPFLWKSLGYSPSYIGTALFLFLFAGGVGSFVSNWVEAKLGAKFVFYMSMILTCPMMFLFLSTYKYSPILSLSIFIAMGFVTMLAQPVLIVMAQKILPEYKSIVSGFINGFSWGVIAVVLTFVSYMAQQFGIAKVLAICSILPVIFSVFVKYLPNTVEENV